MNPHNAPELVAGGFTRNDGAIEFYSRVRSLLPSTGVVLDFGAGRGQAGTEDPVEFRRRLYDLRGENRRVIGVDLNPVVMDNPLLDEAHVLTDDRLPLPDMSVDMIVSDWVLEHVDHAEKVASELRRVLRLGGWLCARTPNRWGYVAVGARMVPNSSHNQVLRRLQPTKKAVDTFPTRYRMNTLGTLRRLFPADRFTHGSYGHILDPVYFGNSRVAIGLVSTISRVIPEPLAPIIYVFIRRDR